MTNVVTQQDVLRKRSTNVESPEEARGILVQLEAAMQDMDNALGLAAIQIGIPKRVAILKHKNPKSQEVTTRHIINAEEVLAEDEFVFFNEGCLSIPNVFLNTKRYRHYEIKNQVIDGDEFREEGLYFYYAKDSEEAGHSGISAIAIQHELAHFEGKLITDDPVEAAPIKNETKKVGRNDPCPCGSGKKYKKCCL
jgi:peptide deformylase